MTEEEQRIAIAEWMGWKRHPNNGWIRPDSDDGQSHNGFCCLPNYLHDLNAMHEAEGKLSDTKRCWFNAKLFEVASGRNLSVAVREPKYIFDALHATAAQRAEALLRAIGKWKD